MPKSEKRVKITLECTECKHRNYITMKSKVNDRERLEMKKYCSHDRSTRAQGDPVRVDAATTRDADAAATTAAHVPRSPIGPLVG